MGALDNKTILFSGVFDGYDRKDLEEQAKAAGAKLLSGVTKNLDYLVAGEKMGPQKKEKADELGVPIISLSDFFAMLPEEAPVEVDIEALEVRLAAFLKANYTDVTDSGYFNYKGTNFQAVFNDDGFLISMGIAEYYDNVDAVLKGISTINKGLDKKLLARMMERDAYFGVEAVVSPARYSEELAKQMIEDIITVKELPKVVTFSEKYGEDFY